MSRPPSSPNTRQAVQRFVELIERHRGRLARAPRRLPAALGARISCEEIGYEAELRRGEKNPEAADNRVRNLRELTGHAARRDRRRHRRAGGEFPGRSEPGLRPRGGKGTHRATPSRSSPCTVARGWNSRMSGSSAWRTACCPHARSKVEGTLDEERRLFYVALTRAMRTLTLSHCADAQEIRPAQALPPLALFAGNPARTSGIGGRKGKEAGASGTGQRAISPPCGWRPVEAGCYLSPSLFLSRKSPGLAGLPMVRVSPSNAIHLFLTVNRVLSASATARRASQPFKSNSAKLWRKK